MKNIIPFKKDIIFKTNLNEITSISLENTLSLIEDAIKGEFIISGEYKISDKSKTVEPFEIKLPFEIVMDDRYDTKSATIDIDDFYYEILNNNVLSVSIDVLVDKLKEKPITSLEDLTEVKPFKEIVEESPNFETIIEENKIEDKTRICKIDEENVETKDDTEKIETNNNREINNEDKVDALFSQFNNNSDVYVTYNVFIVRDGDNIDGILEKYNISLEELKEYNDLTDLKIGDKLIIPCKYERD